QAEPQGPRPAVPERPRDTRRRVVYRFDRVLIDPTPEVLEVTLAAAAAAANKGFRARLLCWPFDDFAEVAATWQPSSAGGASARRQGPRLASIMTRRPRRPGRGWHGAIAQEPGQRQWLGQGAAHKKGAGGDTRSAATVAWWFDPLGRRHCRVV